MRKVINGRTYNTETSKRIGTWDNGLSYSDFSFCEETLYKNTKGAYFLYGEGGARSKYGKQVESNNWSGGSSIEPMTAEEAQEWAEEHLTADEFETEFGEQEEAAPSDLTTRERVNLTIDSELMARFREYSKAKGVPMARLIDKAIAYIISKENA
jgi:predicted DNA binding CopG/RHH family protein